MAQWSATSEMGGAITTIKKEVYFKRDKIQWQSWENVRIFTRELYIQKKEVEG
jgi:hypothetical protein